jgi:ABC-type glycerol-3-phosphate transport system substrate-binding protein
MRARLLIAIALIALTAATLALAGCAGSAATSGDGLPGGVTDTAWAPRSAGLPSFYYFGTPT